MPLGCDWRYSHPSNRHARRRSSSAPPLRPNRAHVRNRGKASLRVRTRFRRRALSPLLSRFAGSGRRWTGFESTCYAVSTDGIHCQAHLGLFEVNARATTMRSCTVRAAVAQFRPVSDSRPGADPAQRYKALGGSGFGPCRLFRPTGFTKSCARRPHQTRRARFAERRVLVRDGKPICLLLAHVRSDVECAHQSRCTLSDFVAWTDMPMEFGDTAPEHLYTNQTTPYFARHCTSRSPRGSCRADAWCPRKR